MNREARPEEVGTLWTAAGVLMGLRYPRDLIVRLLQRVHTMKESTFYQGLLEEGRAEGRTEGAVQEARKLLLRQGRKRFGLPSEDTTTAIQAIRELTRLEQLSERILDVSSWQELLAMR